MKAHDKGPAAGSNCRRSIESCNALQSGEHVRLVSKGLQIECSQGCLPERLGHRNWMLSSNRGHLEYSFAFVGLKTHRGYVTALPQHAPSSVLTYLPTYLPTYLHTHTIEQFRQFQKPDCQKRTRTTQLVIPAVCPEAMSAQVSRPVPAPAMVPASALASYESGLHVQAAGL